MSAVTAVLNKDCLIIRSATDGTPLRDYPYNQTVYVKSPAMQSAQEMTGRLVGALNTVRAPLTLSLLVVSPNTAIVLDILIMNFLVFQLFEGPYLIYPDLILEWASSLSLIPFEFANIFKDWSSKTDCQ